MGRIDPEFYVNEHADRRQRRREARQRRTRQLARRDEAALEEMLKHGAPEALAESAIFVPTYSGSHWERWWLSHYLGPFAGDLIVDVLRPVRGGKEATVYCCTAHPATGLAYVAAKVYRPRIFRNLRNDALYRQGRPVLDEACKPVRDERALRAVRKGTRVGKELEHSSWVAYEFEALRRFYEAGADVPRPLGMGDNAILMEYVGTAEMPAPTLSQIRLRPREARPLLERLLHNVEIMLACGRVHADLSAYNVLYWEGEVKIIDLPQAVDLYLHPDAFALLLRDLERLCRHFARYGIACDAMALAEDMWSRERPRGLAAIEMHDAP